ncbi:hypothetical protein SEVIR_1G350950v4 [Setaria viridis]|uniref:Uncharacterized protein n=1 Tax=Setaria viridis TaxID=4556 RepID=A0A4V6DFW1_SETVI|nr:hypothetical protein SEVIR_1G350950v2 [Setaria viridis]
MCSLFKWCIFSSVEQRGVLISRLRIVQAFLHQSFIGLSYICWYLAFNFQFELADDGRLCCGSIFLWKRVYPPTEESDRHTVIVVEGPYSVEYDSVYVFLTVWLGL